MALDMLDYVLLLAHYWKRLLILTMLPAIIAGALSWNRQAVPESPAPPVAIQTTARQEAARQEVAELRGIVAALSPQKPAIYWPAYDRMRAAEQRLQEALASPPPPKPAPAWPTMRAGRPWRFRVLSAAISGFVLAAMSVFVEAWIRAKLGERSLDERRRQVAEITRR